ncbi:beta-lactamase family protein [Aestuariibacter halophilus]|uniref:Beta-lactamase family protein n=1 Tax=Fluctibacter halophilus TaxID=226011 RepID=A0ABS8GCA4_9ALTE|nr:serine hydrolase domain-containing protein [Aestuariibacter halophilus]MCC2618128.1 beta-lactamase family protein [Aestuariibacter halophilus]
MPVRHIIYGGLGIALLTLSVSAQAADVAPSSTSPTPSGGISLSAVTEQIVGEYVERGWFSGNVLVAHQGQVLFQQSYGLSDRENCTANQPCTRFNLGSIAKHFTAVLVLQQIEKGKLQLNTPIARFKLGIAPDIANKVTVQQLLMHRAGFGDIFTPQYMADPLAYDTLEKKIALLRDRPLLFEPDSEYRYSNYGYILLGAMLENVTGQRFADLLRNNIFTPLGMARTSVSPEPASSCQSQRYHFTLFQSLEKSRLYEVPGPDGGIESTTRDVLQFYRALFYTDGLVNRESDAFKAVFGAQPSHFAGFGGGTGISAAVELDLAADYQVVVLANTDELVAERISSRILQQLRQGRYDPVRLPAKHFVYQVYQQHRENNTAEAIQQAYTDAGFTRFIGRAINEAGMALLEHHQWQDAMGLFDALIALFPNAPQAYDSKAYAFLAQGKQAAAQATFAQALALDPDFLSDYDADQYAVEALSTIMQ